jgi:hypothetical protein
MIDRLGLMAAATLMTFAVAVPSALATYPGRNGTLAYQTDETDGSTLQFSGISSISDSSAAQCSAPDVNGADCTIGRFGYSRAGTRIVAERSGASDQLEVLDARGRQVTILKTLTSADDNPAFLPDGMTIVFDGKVNGKRNIYRVGADGTGLRQLTTKGGSWPAPCANGTIAFVNHGALFVMRANGRVVRRLVRRNAATPDCSPSSKSIVYGGGRGDFMVNTKGGRPRRIKGENGGFPVFSPDGKLVASDDSLVFGDTGGSSVAAIVVVKLKNGHRVRSVEVGDPAGLQGLGPLAWQAKGS